MGKLRALSQLLARLRWRLGLRVAAPELEIGTDESVSQFYSERITDCSFVGDPSHYEHPRVQWILEKVSGGDLLELGCGNGGMTRLLARSVDHIVALDVSSPSVQAVAAMNISNVDGVHSLIEQYRPSNLFDWIVMSEVLEHLRSPEITMARLVTFLAPGGSLLLTTPNSHWESNEHLHEFSFASLSKILARSGAERFTVSYLRDKENRRRWLAAEVVSCLTLPTLNDFGSRSVVSKARRTTNSAQAGSKTTRCSRPVLA
jgi:2-polyprenyl-3-methyl-5-hydroxy-6-metoxy-1,4-benzoquinol methylase